MKNEKMTPKIRFKGFTDAWEERKLSEIVDIYDGTHQTPIYTDSGVKFVSVENISNLETKKYISREAYNKEYAKKQAQKGDVLMTRIGDIGTSRVIETEEPLAYYVTLSLLKPKKIESNFLSWLISSPEVQRNIWKRTLHIAFPKKINLGEISQVEVMIPKNKEQQKIGSFFKQLDDTIALHQRKLDLLKEQKKGYLQKMFPKNGAKVPELRFAGFADAWEERKFGELYKKVNEKNDLSFGKDRVISVANMYFKDTGNIRSDDAYMKTYNIFRTGDIAFEGNRSKHFSYGRFVENTIGDGIVSHVFDVFRPIQQFDLNYWKYAIHNERVMGPILMTATTSSTMMTNLVAKDFLKRAILVPSYSEQKLVGSFFKQLDKTIDLHQRKLDLLKEQKKGFLQNMFV
ncbi:restriction endonuclease subunit S [Fructilactobacillus sanfranciscensis]|uniref:restriction endonuclease subunit S n=1 Tax=Fructilactobacillus sanfranciscensis TaxID=1625 RepID=UPI00111851A0|nr:restriction endonuclease subunit S [Fructilactobacillus sanfranciscensis]TNK97828.1 restriction endonuclease subunit S [Fructilactobacillus sanfranciscensis]